MIRTSARRAGSIAAVPTALTAALAVVFVPAPARALDAEVTNDTAAQFYDVRSPAPASNGAINVLERRRLTTTVGLGLYNLIDPGAPGAQGGRDPKNPDLSFRMRLRYDADYGIPSNETDAGQFQALIPGLNQQLIDLMYAYIEGRRFAGGWLGFKVGRQYMTDVLGWWAFDGAEATVTTPYYFKAEAYGGLEERGGMPLATSRFESDGIWRGSRSNYDPLLYPQFEPARIAPGFAVALESTGVTWIHGRLTYRRVYNEGASNTSMFASGLFPPNVYDQSRISSEKLGYAIDASLGTIGGAKAGIIYDFYRNDVTSIYGSLDAYLGTKVTLSATYDYYVPSFDADSIWNFFAAEPMNDLGIRGNVNFDDHLSFAGGAHARIYTVQTDAFAPVASGYSPAPNMLSTLDVYPSNGHPMDGGGDLQGRWRGAETTLSLRAAGDWGSEGHRSGADLVGEHVFESRYVASVRTGVWQWEDALRPDRSTTSFQYVLGAGYRFAERSRGTVEWEHDINGLVGQRFRILFLLSLGIGK